MQPKRYGLVITTILMIIVVLMSGCARPVQSAVYQSDKPRLVSDASDAELAELVGGNSGYLLTSTRRYENNRMETCSIPHTASRLYWR